MSTPNHGGGQPYGGQSSNSSRHNSDPAGLEHVSSRDSASGGGVSAPPLTYTPPYTPPVDIKQQYDSYFQPARASIDHSVSQMSQHYGGPPQQYQFVTGGPGGSPAMPSLNIYHYIVPAPPAPGVPAPPPQGVTELSGTTSQGMTRGGPPRPQSSIMPGPGPRSADGPSGPSSSSGYYPDGAVELEAGTVPPKQPSTTTTMTTASNPRAAAAPRPTTPRPTTPRPTTPRPASAKPEPDPHGGGGGTPHLASRGDRRNGAGQGGGGGAQAGAGGQRRGGNGRSSTPTRQPARPEGNRAADVSTTRLPPSAATPSRTRYKQAGEGPSQYGPQDNGAPPVKEGGCCVIL